MTLQELQGIQNFSALFHDARFMACLVYLRSNFPNAKAADAGEWRGYFLALERLENLNLREGKSDKAPERTAPYMVPGITNKQSENL